MVSSRKCQSRGSPRHRRHRSRFPSTFLGHGRTRCRHHRHLPAHASPFVSRLVARKHTAEHNIGPLPTLAPQQWQRRQKVPWPFCERSTTTRLGVLHRRHSYGGYSVRQSWYRGRCYAGLWRRRGERSCREAWRQRYQSGSGDCPKPARSLEMHIISKLRTSSLIKWLQLRIHDGERTWNEAVMVNNVKYPLAAVTV